ncbi:hypothetical protein [Burkholderia stagnalis]|uniref:hypothetical protein n=1 Tax=Burkholderia stagnalis TaxID=1503054 RepID=UPI0007558B29|nr:hypothetical protein [Burkholderia stagnalis]KVL93747.1 hypothetical protein WT03_14985 [Burkholderia stagnalis]
MELSIILSDDDNVFRATLGQFIETNIAATQADRILAQAAADSARTSANVASESAAHAVDSASAGNLAANRAEQSASAAAASQQSAALYAQSAQSNSIDANTAASQAASSASAASTSASNAAQSASAAAVSEKNAAATLANALTRQNNLTDVADKAVARTNLDVPSKDALNTVSNSKVDKTGDVMTGGLSFKINAAGNAVGVSYIRYDQTTAFWAHATPTYYAVARHDVAGKWLANTLLIDKDGSVTLEKRPVWGGQTPWDTGNFNPASKLDAGARAASSAKLLIGGVDSNFNWSGQGGQPAWIWGGNDQYNMYVYNPSNFSVSYANSAGSVNGVGNPAQAGAQCQWSGTAEFGAADKGAETADVPAPWVMFGVRVAAWRGPSGDCIGRLVVRGVWLRNQ